MFKFDRDGNIALGLVVGVLATVLFFVYVPYFNKDSDDEYSHASNHSVEQGQPSDINRLVTALERFDPWDDTYAQWLMAAFSIAATVASIYAVKLLRDTLKATRKAVKSSNKAVAVTRRIGEAQVRAYVHASIPEFQWDKPPVGEEFGGVKVSYEWENKGQSPALEFGGVVSVEFLAPEEIGSPIAKFETVGFEVPLGFSIITPQGTKRIGKVTIGSDTIKKWSADPEACIMVVYSAVTYKDVFGRVWHSECCSEIIQEYDSKGQPQLTGKAYPHHNKT